MATSDLPDGYLVNEAVKGDAAVQSQVLEELASAKNYRRWLVELASERLTGPVLEVGSGLGEYASDLADRGFTVTATEAHPERVVALKQRFAMHPRVSAEELTVPIDRIDEYGSLVTFNVLEHIEDDVAALKAFSGLCRPGADIVAIVPAFPIGMSDFDREIGHARRYRKATLEATAKAADLDVVELRHINSIGLIAWILMVRLRKGRPRQGLGLVVFDRILVPVLRRLERVVEPPFGQSLLLHARVPE